MVRASGNVEQLNGERWSAGFYRCASPQAFIPGVKLTHGFNRVVVEPRGHPTVSTVFAGSLSSGFSRPMLGHGRRNMRSPMLQVRRC
jgi:hypothetical protein